MKLCSGYRKSADIYLQLRQALVPHTVAYHQGFPITEFTFLGLEVYFSCHMHCYTSGWSPEHGRWQAAEQLQDPIRRWWHKCCRATLQS